MLFSGEKYIVRVGWAIFGCQLPQARPANGVGTTAKVREKYTARKFSSSLQRISVRGMVASPDLCPLLGYEHLKR
jgi:hypothetical protein